MQTVWLLWVFENVCGCCTTWLAALKPLVIDFAPSCDYRPGHSCVCKNILFDTGIVLLTNGKHRQ